MCIMLKKIDFPTAGRQKAINNFGRNQSVQLNENLQIAQPITAQGPPPPMTPTTAGGLPCL